MPPTPGEPSKQPRRRFRSILLSRPALGVTAGLTVAIAGGSARLLVFINEELAPLVSEELSTSLKRPVEVGELTHYSLTGLRFGPSALPAYETQVDGQPVTDQDTATTDAVEVSFDVWKTLLTQTLNLDVTLVNPKLYIDEDEPGRWLLTQLPETDDPEQATQIQLDTLRVRNGQAVIVPIGAAARTVTELDGEVNLTDTQLDVQGKGSLDSGGTVRVKGQWHLEREALNLKLNLDEVTVTSRLGLVPTVVPLTVHSATLSGNFDLNVQPQQPLQVTGNTKIDGIDVALPAEDVRVTARQLQTQFRVRYVEDQPPQVTGQAQFEGATVAAPEQLILQNGRSRPQRLLNVRGRIRAREDTDQVQFGAQGTLASGGRLRVNGTTDLNLDVVDVQLAARNLNAPLLDQAFDLPLEVAAGRADANLNLRLRPNIPDAPVEVAGRAQVANADVRLPEQDIRVKAQQFRGIFRMVHRPNQQPKIGGQAQFQGAELAVPEQLIFQNGRSQPQRLRNAQGQLNFIEDRNQVRFQARADLASGGQLQARGVTALDLQTVELQLAAQDISAPILDQAFELPIQITAGQVDADMAFKLRMDQLPDVRGTARLRNIDAQLVGLPQPFYNANGQIRFQGGLTTALENVTALYDRVPLQASGVVDIDKGYNLTAQTQPVAIQTAFDTLGLDSAILPVPLTGKVYLPRLRVTGAIEQPVLTGQVAAAPGTKIDRVPFTKIVARFRLAAPQLQIDQVAAFPAAGGVITGDAQSDLTPGAPIVARLQARNIPGDAMARLYEVPAGVTVGPVFAQVAVAGPPEQIQTTVAFQARQATYPTRGTLRLSNGTIALDKIVADVANGTATLKGQVTPQQLQAQVQLAGIELQQFSTELQGELDGRLDVTGPVATLGPDTLRAEGRLRFSRGLSLIQEPLTAGIGWDGRQILVTSAAARGFEANGTLAAQLQGPQGPQITGLDLNIFARDYALRSLSAFNPTPVPVTGRADLKGRLTGTLDAPQLRATLTLKQLAAAKFAFEPKLAGTLTYGQGVALDVQGRRDRIQVALDAQFQPQSFLVRRNRAIATGETRDEGLTVNVERFPLTDLRLRPIPELGPITGLASGRFTANLNSPSLVGQITIDQPGVGQLRSDQFTAKLRYQDGIAALDNGVLTRQDSRYTLSAQLDPGMPNYAAQFQVDRGQIQDLVAVAQTLQTLRSQPTPLEPQGTAADVQTMAVGDAMASLWQQLQTLAEAQTLVAQQRATQTAPPFELADLKGEFNGEINLSATGTLIGQVQGTVDLRGQDFTLGDYRVQDVVVAGNLENGKLTLAPLRLATGDRNVTFTGRVGFGRQSGELLVNNVPIDALTEFVGRPVTGNLNGSAKLSGFMFKPKLAGQLSLSEAQVGETPITQANAEFRYQSMRLRFKSTAFLDTPQPIQIVGTVPIGAPDDAPIAIDANVQNEGLALVSLVTDQVAWGGGQGQADVQISGTLAQPLFKGTVILDNATIRTPTLTEPLQNITGTIQVNRDRVTVPSLVGTYEQRPVKASGSLPLFDPVSQPQPLTVRFDNLDVSSVAGLYKGGVTGKVTVTGTALQPSIGGTVELNNGEILLGGVAGSATTPTANPEPEQRQFTILTPSSQAAAPAAEASTPAFPLRFNNLQLQLNDKVSVTQAPLLSLVARGDLAINGPVEAPELKGRIRFRKGTVNLITSRFQVDPRQENYADFDPKFGVDPYLKIGLRTTVTEVTQARTTALNEAEEVPAASLGAFQSVRVRAAVDGRASQLINDFQRVVEVTSSPRRSEGEILALLGGGTSEAVQEGQFQQAAVNLASSAAFTGLQNVFDNLLGSRASFRAFPVLLPDANEGEASVLSLGGELGYDVTDRFSVSVLQVLTGIDEPTLVNLNYDINRNLTVRTSISTDGEAVGTLEYRIRF